MIVIDASLAFEISIAARGADALTVRMMAVAGCLGAPEVIELEFLQTLRRYLGRGEFDRERADEAIRNFADLRIERFLHAPLRARIWDLRDNLTAYDAAYVALAEHIDAPLWTRDEKLRTVPGHAARVELI